MNKSTQTTELVNLRLHTLNGWWMNAQHQSKVERLIIVTTTMN